MSQVWGLFISFALAVMLERAQGLVAEVGELQTRQTQLLIEQHNLKDKADTLEDSLKLEQQESLSLKS